MIWVRTQNKENITHVKGFSIEAMDDGSFSIIGYFADGDYFYLGKYSTKEKAMHVMDLIARYIVVNIRHENDCFLQPCVLQMPADDEVL